MYRTLSILVITSLLIFNYSYSVEIKQKTGLVIHSDESIVNFRTGINIYKGNVVISTGQIELKADKVKEYKEKGLTIKAEAEGQPLEFKKVDNQGNMIMSGYAEKAFYFKIENKLILFDYSLTNAQGDHITGKKGEFILENISVSK